MGPFDHDVLVQEVLRILYLLVLFPRHIVGQPRKMYPTFYGDGEVRTVDKPFRRKGLDDLFENRYSG